MSTTLPLYYTLASRSTSERLDASATLLLALEQFQAQHSVPSAAEGDVQRQFEALNAADVQYAVNRLVKGLASSREQSRMGFAVALTALLERIPTISCAHVISLILSTTQIAAGTPGAEQRDLLFAKLFGLTAAVESGVLFRSQPPAIGSSTLKLLPTLDDFMTVVSELMDLGEKKTWLRESAWWAVLRAVDALQASDVSWKKAAITRLCSEVFNGSKDWTLEKLALGLKLQRMYPELAWGPMVAPTFKQSNLLGAANLSIIARLFKGAAAEEADGPNKSSGSWKPQLHFAWDMVLDSYFIPTSQGKLSPPSEFQDFFRLVVDDSLFASTASDVRKSWGFQVFAKALPRIPAAQLPLIFTPNFMRTWINHLSRPDRFLHKAALALVDEIHKVTQHNPSVAYTLVAELTGKNGNQRFDQITKTKTVQSLVESMDAVGVEAYVKFLLEAAYGGVEAENATGIDTKRAWILDQLQNLLRNTAIPKNDAWVGSIMEFLTVHGFFITKKTSSKSSIASLHTLPEPLFSSATQEKCREKLYASLTLLNTQRKSSKAKPQENGKVTGELQAVDWFGRSTALLQKLSKDKKHVMPVLEADDEIVGLRSGAAATLSNIVEKPNEKTAATASCVLVLQYLTLQTYADDIDVSEILPDALNATSRLLGLASTSENSEEEAEAAPIDMLMDVLMALLESDTGHARELVAQVFDGLTKEVLPSTIQFIAAQLESKSAGEEDDEDGEEDVEMHSDDDDSDNVDADEAESDGGEETTDEEDDSDEEDEAQTAANAALRARLGQVLRENGLAADTDEEEDDDEDDSDEDIVDDDTMLQLDDQLAAALRSQVGDKKGQKNAQREATHFRIRVIDLVDIFMKNEPTSELLLQLIVPLLDIALFSSSDEAQLSKRATGVLTSRLGGAKELPEPATPELAVETLREVYDRMRRVDPAPVVLHCCTFLTKVLSRQGKEASPALVSFYSDALKVFVMRRSPGVPVTLFSTLITSVPVGGWALRDTILNLMVDRDAVNRFNQRKLLDLLVLLFKQPVSQNASSEQLIEFFTSVRKTVLAALSQALDASSFPTDYVRDLLKCLHRGIRASSKTVLGVEQDTVWDPSALKALAVRLEKEHSNAASVRNLASEVMKALRPEMEIAKPAPTSKKPKTPSVVNAQLVTNVVDIESPKPKKLKRVADSEASGQTQKKKKVKTSS
ncbi:hypothetical protein CALCODRAFT_480671 [Calocera cornea HHB12733]|uniref:DNA polymerase phi-domain-containing protein n=1 Tax=Calocera cornea HHB12733 TaxID=1353952 RepID=A0A165IBJ0_9BASI|nr:hypothetical protein CALCODRAFT_480671 [Calocera cornea HHB12733]